MTESVSIGIWEEESLGWKSRWSWPVMGSSPMKAPATRSICFDKGAAVPVSLMGSREGRFGRSSSRLITERRPVIVACGPKTVSGSSPRVPRISGATGCLDRTNISGTHICRLGRGLCSCPAPVIAGPTTSLLRLSSSLQWTRPAQVDPPTPQVERTLAAVGSPQPAGCLAALRPPA